MVFGVINSHFTRLTLAAQTRFERMASPGFLNIFTLPLRALVITRLLQNLKKNCRLLKLVF